MDQNLTDDESLISRVQQLERERNELQKDIEQLCMQQAGPAYLGVATRMHFQRTAVLEHDIENLKNQLTTCTRENQNLQEELSEAYRIKTQLADLHSAEVLKNVEAEKQLKFFQGCVAAAFAERDNAILEAEKAKEKEELMPQELNKSLRRVEELTAELLEEKEQATKLRIDLEKHEVQNEIFREVIDKFYRIRQFSLENFTDASWEEKCESLMNDSDEMWRFQNEEDTSTSSYINSLEAEIENLRRSVDSLQNKLRVGLEIESHFKKKVRNLEKKNSRTEGKFKKQISALLQHHSQYKIDVVSLLDEGYSEIKSLNDVVIEKMRQFDTECYSKSCQNQDKVLHESECKDVHISADSRPVSITKSNDRSLTTPTAPETGDYSGALALALHEKVAALLLLSQQEERHLLERNVNAALQKKIEELQRNLLQVTNEKVKALMELAQLKQERYKMQEKIARDNKQGKSSGETGERSIPEKDGKLKNLLRRSYLTRWVGVSDASDTDGHQHYEKPNPHMDFARIKIENATLKESLESMEHLLSSVRRLRISLFKAKVSSAEEIKNTSWFDDVEQIISEANLVKTAVGSSLPISWSAETDGSIQDDCKVDFVSAAGFEMMELLIFAAHLLKDLICDKHRGDGDLSPAGSQPEAPAVSAENATE